MGLIDQPAAVMYGCDGPACEALGESNSAVTPPEGWLRAWGPAYRLGEFVFHSGACYDAWKLETDAMAPGAPAAPTRPEITA